MFNKKANEEEEDPKERLTDDELVSNIYVSHRTRPSHGSEAHHISGLLPGRSR